METLKISRTDKVKGWLRKRYKSPSRSPSEELSASPKPTVVPPPETTEPLTVLGRVDSKLSNDALREDDEVDKSPLSPQLEKAFSVDLWKHARQLLDQKEQKLLDSTSDGAEASTVLSDLQKLANDKKAAAEGAAWKIEFAGRRIALRDIVVKIAGWTTSFKEIGDWVVSLDPVHAALPWAAVKLIFQVVTLDHTQMGLILIGLEQVTSLITRCTAYQMLYLDGIAPKTNSHANAMNDLCTSITKLYAKTFSFLAYFIRRMDKNFAVKTLQTIVRPNEVSDILSSISGLKDRAEMDANLCEKQLGRLASDRTDRNFQNIREQLTDLVSRLDEDLAGFKNKLDEDERCKILQWVSDVPYESDHYTARKGRVDGTGEWLLQHPAYKSWRESTTSTVLWLNAIPGAGKTKLSSKVVDDLLSVIENDHSGSQGFAYFYCDRNRSDHRDPVAILRSIVRQLCAPRDNSCVDLSVETTYVKRKRKGFANDRLASEETRDLLFELAQGFTQIHIVIDGLDECARETRHVLMDILDQVAARRPQLVKIYIASRKDEDLRKRYSEKMLLEVAADDIQADIERFVSEKMKKMEFKMSEKVRLQILKTVQEKSQGMFQWAVLHVGELLELKRNNAILKFLNQLPTGLKASYDNIHQQISNQKGGKADIAFAAFKILMCSWRPLSPSELVVAVVQDPEVGFLIDDDVDIDYVLDACHNLVVVAGNPEASEGIGNKLIGAKLHYMGDYTFKEIENSKKAVNSISICRFSHLSVQEYLEDHHWTIQEANEFMAGICLRTLLCLRLPDGAGDTKPPEQLELEDDEDRPPVLIVGETERAMKLEVIWQGKKESIAADSDMTLNATKIAKTTIVGTSLKVINDESNWPKDTTRASYEPPPFQCFYEFVHIHEYHPNESCISAEFDPYIDDYRNTAVEHWALYAAQAFALHARRAQLGDMGDSVFSDLLTEFLGTATTSSPHYRAWAVLNQSNQDITMDRPELLRGPDTDRFPRSLVRPTTEPAYGCALMGLHWVLEPWLRNGESDPNKTNLKGDSLLILAAEGCHFETCKVLLAHGADPNSRGFRRLSPLDIAVEKKRVDIVVELLRHGADPNTSMPHKLAEDAAEYPLIQAVLFGDLDVVNALLQHDTKAEGAEAAVTSSDSPSSDPALLHREIILEALDKAAMVGDAAAAAAKILMAHVTELRSSAALHRAVYTGSWEFARVLIEGGADVDMRAPDTDEQRFRHSDTPLLALARADPVEILHKVQQLLDWGPDVNARDLQGRTPLFLLVQQPMTYNPRKDNCAPTESREEVIQLLLKRGADPNAKDNDGMPVFVAACLCETASASVIRTLIDHGADVNISSGANHGSKTPLDVASQINEQDDREQRLLNR